MSGPLEYHRPKESSSSECACLPLPAGRQGQAGIAECEISDS